MPHADPLPIVKCVRDCGVIRAKGKAIRRFVDAQHYGYIQPTFVDRHVADFRLTAKGRKVVDAWAVLSR